jgi:hypothetical protein
VESSSLKAVEPRGRSMYDDRRRSTQKQYNDLHNFMTKSPDAVERDIIHIKKFNEVYEEELNKSEITGIKNGYMK